jgi:hypothetical protein
MKLKTPATKARRTLIAMSEEIKLEGYMMPNSFYTLNRISLSKAVKKHRFRWVEVAARLRGWESN